MTHRSFMTLLTAALALVLAAAVFAPTVSADIAPLPSPRPAEVKPVEPSENGGTVPFTDIDAAFASATEAGKPVYVHYTAPWCVPCKKIKAEVYPRPRVAARLARFVRAEVDIQSTDAGRRAWKNHVLKRDKSGKTGGWAQPPLPSMLIYRDGTEVEGVRMTGSLTEDSIIVGLDRAIAAVGQPPVEDAPVNKAAPAAAGSAEPAPAPASGGCSGGAPVSGSLVLMCALGLLAVVRRR